MMRFIFAELNNVLGLKGNIDFLKNPTLFYGRNLAGKTNIINVIRYCFVTRKSGGQKYCEEKRLSKDELLNQFKNGFAVFYFEHKGKLYKLEYLFQKTHNQVNQKIHLYETTGQNLTSLDEKVLDSLKSLTCREIANNFTQLKEKLVEMEIYPDMIDTLISPSNVKNFESAINDELVTIPEIIAKRISDLNIGSRKYIENLEKLGNVILREEENYTNRLDELTSEFEKISSKKHDEVTSIFNIRKVSENLKNQSQLVEDELQKIPTKEIQLEGLRKDLSNKFKEGAKKILNAKSILKSEETVIKYDENLSVLSKSREVLSTWKTTFKNLPSVEYIDSLINFEIPTCDDFNFKLLLSPEKIKKIFESVKQSKKLLDEVAKIAHKHKIPIRLSDFQSQINSYKRLKNAIRSPEDEPKGNKAIISYHEKEGESIIHLPIETIIENPDYLRDIKSVPSVYKTKKMNEKELKKLLSSHLTKIEQTVKDLEECKTKLKTAIEKIKEVKGSLIFLDEEIGYLADTESNNRKELDALKTNWQTNYGSLTELFDLKPYKIDLTNKYGIKNFISYLEKTLKEVEKQFIDNLKGSFHSAGVELPKDLDLEKVSDIESLLKKESEDLSIKRQKLNNIKNWISLNSNEIETIENKVIMMLYIKTTISVLKIILQKIQEHTNLEVMSEQIAQTIEENVKKCMVMILPEEMIEFKHIGRGKFIVQTSSGEPITHPAGSHKSVISLGIMLTLSKVFDLPVLLDEATDRFDYITLKNVLQYITMVCSVTSCPQICLVSYRTRNIEKNQEIVDIIKNWNIYLLERKGKLNKEITKMMNINQFLE
jgi:hypothetical protein